MSWDGDRDGRETDRERALVSCHARESGHRERGRGHGLGPPLSQGRQVGQAALASLLFSRTKA